MKKLFYLFLAMMLIGVSCEDSSKEVDSTPKGVVFDDGTEMSAEFGSNGGSKSFSFSSDLDWEVTTSADWISVTPSSGTPSVKTFTVKASANDSFEERSGTVTMTTTDDRSYTIEVTQAAENETFTINGNGEYEVSATGGEVEVKVTTNLEYTVEIPAEAKAWLSVADTRAVREETLTFTVAENETLDERSATVELKGADGKVLQSIVFKQKEYGGTIEVDEEYVVDAEGGELEVKLSTDIDFTTSIPEEAKSWISIVETRSMRSESLTFNIAINDDVKERSATINLQNAKGNDVASFVIRQKGGDAVLELKNQYSISNMGGNFEVAVTTNLEYEVEISADATSWLSYVETRALRTDKLIFNATPNEGDAERSGTIKLIGEDNEELQVITVTQRGNIFEFAYTTNDGKPLSPITTEGFGGEFKENIFDAATGEGKLVFAGAVTTIPGYAFGLCENLTWIEIPLGITSIGASAFSGCSSMVELTIPASVTSVGSEAFKGCTGKAYINCSGVSFSSAGFAEVVIGDSVTTIGDYAFSSCDSLTSITIPDSVTTIGGDAFRDCDSLTNVYISDIAAWCNISFSSFASNPLSNGAYLYLNNDRVTDLTIPDSVTLIGDWAFYRCYGLTSVTIPDSVTTIGGSAFNWCDSLTSVTIPDSVTIIEAYAFSNCSSLTSVYCEATTPPSLSGSDVFDYNASDRKIYVPAESVEAYKTADYWNEYADAIIAYDFENGVVVEPEVSINNVIHYTATAKVEMDWTFDTFGANIVSHEWNSETGEGIITFNADVTTIGKYAFEDCLSLTGITIPDSITTIGEGAFYLCRYLTGITIPNSVTTIGDCAFHYCDSLTSITIPDSVTTIGAGAFYYCSKLASITIPNSVTTIGNEAFDLCRSLASVYCEATTPPSLGSYAFSRNASERLIYVPAASVEAYKTAYNWSEYADAIVAYDFENGVVVE